MAGLELGDRRLDKRALNILQARWNQPQASFRASFSSGTPAKGGLWVDRTWRGGDQFLGPAGAAGASHPEAHGGGAAGALAAGHHRP